MAYITSADFVKWDGTLFTNSDWDANVDAVATLTSAGTRDSAWSKVGIGTTTLNYPLNIQEGSLSRGANITMTTAGAAVYGQYITMSGASSANIGLEVAASGATTNTAIIGSVVSSNVGSKALAGYVQGTRGIAVYGLNTATGTTVTAIQATCNGAATTSRGFLANCTGSSINYQLFASDGTESYIKVPYVASVDGTATPTNSAVENGTMCVGYVSGVYKLYAYLSGAWKSVNLT